MKYLFMCLGFIMAGMIGIIFIVMFQNVTVNNESEYYVLKEAVEAAMYESIDIDYYRDTNEIKIIEEKFVANCTRRFYASISGFGSGYQLTFYDIMETPPKVTVVANNKTGEYVVSTDGGFDIINDLSGILEFNY